MLCPVRILTAIGRFATNMRGADASASDCELPVGGYGAPCSRRRRLRNEVNLGISGERQCVPRISAAIMSAASSCSAGSTCEYVSSVMAMLAWPRRSLTTFAGTPAASAADA